MEVHSPHAFSSLLSSLQLQTQWALFARTCQQLKAVRGHLSLVSLEKLWLQVKTARFLTFLKLRGHFGIQMMWRSSRTRKLSITIKTCWENMKRAMRVEKRFYLVTTIFGPGSNLFRSCLFWWSRLPSKVREGCGKGTRHGHLPSFAGNESVGPHMRFWRVFISSHMAQGSQGGPSLPTSSC